MPQTGQPPRIEAESNSYLQQEIDLSQNIIDTIKTSPEILKAVDVSEKSKGHRQRISRELEELREKKNEYEVAIEDIKSDFGSEDSFADLKKLEEYNLKLKTALEAIPLLEQKLNSESPFSKDVKIKADDAEHTIRFVLQKINVRLQEDIDAKVNDLLQTFSMYRAAIERVRIEQDLIPSRLLKYGTLSNIMPELKGLDKLLPFDRAAMAGGIQRGLTIASEAKPLVEEPIVNIFQHKRI